MSPRTLMISAAVAAGLTAGATAAEATGPVAGAAKSCGFSRSLGATYVTRISAKRVSCAKAKDVIRAFNACRKDHGGADGRCPSKVAGGFRCNEGKRLRGPISIDADVSCRKGAKRVKFHYQQDT